MPESDQPRSLLAESAFLRGLSTVDLHRVSSEATTFDAPAGTVLFRQGEQASRFLFLDSGRVRLREVTEDGRELLVRFVVPGEVFGDRAATTGSQYGGTAIGDSRARIYWWPTAAIAALLHEIPRLSANLLDITVRYLHYSRRRHRLLASASAENRIRWALSDMARRFGMHEGKATVITGRSLQSDIADLAVTTIYTVSRVLRNYEQRGLLDRHRGRIVLLPRFD